MSKTRRGFLLLLHILRLLLISLSKNLHLLLAQKYNSCSTWFRQGGVKEGKGAKVKRGEGGQTQTYIQRRQQTWEDSHDTSKNIWLVRLGNLYLLCTPHRLYFVMTKMANEVWASSRAFGHFFCAL